MRDRILAVEVAGMTDKDTIVDIEDELIFVLVRNLAVLRYCFYNSFDFDVHIVNSFVWVVLDNMVRID